MTDWGVLFQPWNGAEGDLRPERKWTPWAHPGWLAWNEHAVELQVAEFLAKLGYAIHEVSDDFLAIETGVGQGYVTRRLIGALNPATARIWTFESDLEWAGRLRQLDYWLSHLNACIKWETTPTPSQMKDASFVILDSMDPWRKMEMMLWAEVAPEGSVLFVHDTGTIHPTNDGHFSNGFMIKQMGLTGYWLENPRGSFMAQKGQLLPDNRYKALWDHTLEQIYSFE
jgi:hypothetical protein